MKKDNFKRSSMLLRELFSDKVFVIVAGALFALTGSAKIVALVHPRPILSVIDPISMTRLWSLMLMAGILELGVALVCFLGKRTIIAVTLVAVLATNILVYRMGLLWMGWHRPCSCLGNLTDALHISPQVADNIMKVVLAYLLVGSYALLFKQWRQNRKVANGSADVHPA